jgi:hypothetical protein
MSPVATLVERSTRYLMLVGLPDGHRAELVADALGAAITRLPRQLTRSLTWDQGHEMAAHARFTPSTPASRSTSAIRRVRGSAAATRTRTGCCASTCPGMLVSETSASPTSTASPPNSTAGLDRLSGSRHHPKHRPRCCDDRLSPQACPDDVGAAARRFPVGIIGRLRYLVDHCTRRVPMVLTRDGGVDRVTAAAAVPGSRR